MKKQNFVWIILPLSLFIISCVSKNQQATNNGLYDELYRPQFHFSPEEKWMNDPNGMVYLNGEYHLFYQYYPDSTVWGPMHWGHAVSTDLVHWQHLPIALYPDSLGYIFSGSAVYDQYNTSELGTLENPPLVAIFTYHNIEKERAGQNDYQTQGIAYSTDKGRTWAKYNQNPVLSNPGIRDFRDPKVLWYQKDQKWIMTLAVQNHVEFYSSPNLKEWKKESDFGIDKGAHGGVWECPELLQIEQEVTHEKKWVLISSINPGGLNGGSATQYFVGNFDGNTFNTDQTETKWIDFGADNYAGVTWSNIPKADGRTLFIGWMSNWQYAEVVPTDKWRSAMTFPRELVLTTDNHIMSTPVKELENLRSRSAKLKEKNITNSVDLTTEIPFSIEHAELNFDFQFESQMKTISLVFSNSKEEKLVVKIDKENQSLTIDRTKSGSIMFSKYFYARHTAPIKLEKELKIQILLDVSSIELFANDGLITMTDIFFPSEPFSNVMIETEGDPVILKDCTIYKLNSIW